MVIVADNYIISFNDIGGDVFFDSAIIYA